MDLSIIEDAVRKVTRDYRVRRMAENGKSTKEIAVLEKCCVDTVRKSLKRSAAWRAKKTT